VSASDPDSDRRFAADIGDDRPGQGPPLPTRQIMHQWWRDISFVHWRVEPALVASWLPRGVHPDIHDGGAWVGLIPFHMVDAGIGHGPAVPHLGTFLETNVRVYSVDDQDRHGVVFCSLEAERLAVALGANAGFGVPYKYARMSRSPGIEALALGDPTGRRLRYETVRRTRAGPRSLIEVTIGAEISEPSPLDLFLTARFGLHSSVLGRTVWIPNTHRPWPLRQAELVHLDDELLGAVGFADVADRPPDSVLFSTGVETVFGLPQRVR
jgi:uncharacterized protein YqjF (DUF2071 family)